MLSLQLVVCGVAAVNKLQRTRCCASAPLVKRAARRGALKRCSIFEPKSSSYFSDTGDRVTPTPGHIIRSLGPKWDIIIIITSRAKWWWVISCPLLC